MTGRLISADALYTLFVKMKSFGELTAKKAIRCVEEAPTVDAEPVRHGKWIDEGQYADFFPHHAWRCSECGEHVIEIDTPWGRYCSNCGAKMDGEDEQPSSEDCDQIFEFVMERLKAEKTLERLGQILGEVFGKIDETIDDCCNEFLKEEEKKNETE